MRWRLFLLALLTACSASNLQEYCEEGEALVGQIADQLESCRSREELQEKLPRLRKQFLALVQLMVEAREYQLTLDQDAEGALSDGRASDRLRSEMQRLYEIEGGRQLIEQAQAEALHKLDGYEKKGQKKKKL